MKYNLIDLLEKKSFSELNESERNFICLEMDEREYSQQREILILMKNPLTEEEKALSPNPNIPLVAIAALRDKRKKKKPFLILLFTHKVPTWAVIAASFLVFFLSSKLFFVDKPNNMVVHTESQNIDTVYRNNTISIIDSIFIPNDTIIKTVYKYINSPSSPIEIVSENTLERSNTTLAFTDDILNMEGLNITTLISTDKKSKGISVKNDSLLQLVNADVSSFNLY